MAEVNSNVNVDVNSKVIPALGQSNLRVGQLYNYCYGKVVPDEAFSSEISTYTKVEQIQQGLSKSCLSTEALNILGLDLDSKLNVLLELVVPEGAASAILVDQGYTDGNVTTAYVHQYKTRFEGVKRDDLQALKLNPESQDKIQQATHIITGITYGCTTIFKAFENLEGLAETNFSIECLELEEQKADIEGCIFSDIPPKDVRCSLKDALQHMKNTDETLNEREDLAAIPLTMHLSTIASVFNEASKPFAELDAGLAEKAISLLEGFRKTSTWCDKLTAETDCKPTGPLLQRISQFKALTEKNKENIVEDLVQLIPGIREKSDEESDLSDLLEEEELSPFKGNYSGHWLKAREHELTKVKYIVNQLQEVPFIRTSREFRTKVASSRKATVFCFIIQWPEKDQLIQGMEKRLKEDDLSRAFELDSNLSFDSSVLDLAHTKFEDIIKKNDDKDNQRFFYAVETTHVESLQGVVNVWKEGKLVMTDLRFPCQIQNLRVREVTDCSLYLDWEVDNCTGEKFKIWYWASIQDIKTITSKENHILIDNLMPSTKYTCKVRSDNDVFEYNNCSEVSVQTGKQDVTSPPGKPVCYRVNVNNLRLEWEKPARIPDGISILKYLIYGQNENLIKDVQGDKLWVEISFDTYHKLQFTVVADCGEHGTSQQSDPSDPNDENIIAELIPSNLITIPATGTTHEIGQWFNRCEDQVLVEKKSSEDFDLEKALFEKSLQQYIYTVKQVGYSEVFDWFGMDPNTRLNIDIGLSQPIGAISSLLDSKEDITSRKFILYRLLTRVQLIDSKRLDEISPKPIEESATHIVAGITYGCDVISWKDESGNKVFFHDLDTNSSYENIEDTVTALKRRLKEKPLQAVPLLIHLYCRKDTSFLQIEPLLASRTLALLNHYKAVESKCTKLLKDKKYQRFNVMLQKVMMFQSLYQKKREELKEYLRKIIPVIRTKDSNSELISLMGAEENSPFSWTKSRDWFQSREKDIGKIGTITEKLKTVPLITSQLELKMTLGSHKQADVICLLLNMPEEDDITRAMKFSLSPNSYEETISVTHQSNLGAQVNTFLDMWKMYGKENSLKFLFHVAQSKVAHITENIHLYQNGELKDENFFLFGPPNSLSASKVTDTSFLLKWKTSKKISGKEQFEVNCVQDGKTNTYATPDRSLMIENVLPEKRYSVKVCSVSGPIKEFSQKISVTTQKADATSPPGKPSWKSISYTQIALEWEAPKRISKPIIHYEVYDDGHCLQKLSPAIRTLLEVKPNKRYKFTVKADCDPHGKSKHSETSHPYEKIMTVNEITKERIKAKCTKVTKVWKKGGIRNVYLLPLKETWLTDKVRKCEFGEPMKGGTREKVVMFLGATGSGKTTLINGMINYILGIEWDDDFRVRLIPEEDKASNQAHSQTTMITAYTIYSKTPQQWTPDIEDTRFCGQNSHVPISVPLTSMLN